MVQLFLKTLSMLLEPWLRMLKIPMIDQNVAVRDCPHKLITKQIEQMTVEGTAWGWDLVLYMERAYFQGQSHGSCQSSSIPVLFDLEWVS